MVRDDEEPRETAYEDAEKEAHDNAYRAAECEEPHEDGSSCRPSWDGFGFICLYRSNKEAEILNQPRPT